jgi:hypothetical protein
LVDIKRSQTTQKGTLITPEPAAKGDILVEYSLVVQSKYRGSNKKLPVRT